MRTSAKALSLSAVLLTLAACGGVGSIDSPDGGGPGGEGGPGNTEEGGVGNPQCPALSQVDDGLSCDVNGLTCPASQPVYDCHGTPLATPQCVCDGASWTCEDLVPTDTCESPPGTACPDPGMLIPGASCDGSIMQSCVTLNSPMPDCDGGTVSTKAVCTCGPANSWICPPIATVTCAEPPPECPDPNSIIANAPCKGDMLVCPGNPTSCDGQTFYDGFECEGVWVPISATSCAGDGGPIDASPPDATPIFDATPSAD